VYIKESFRFNPPLIFPGFLGDMTPHSFSRIFIELVVSSNGKAYFKKFSYRGLSKLLFIVLSVNFG
jgi:hypothetical protein